MTRGGPEPWWSGRARGWPVGREGRRPGVPTPGPSWSGRGRWCRCPRWGRSSQAPVQTIRIAGGAAAWWIAGLGSGRVDRRPRRQGRCRGGVRPALPADRRDQHEGGEDRGGPDDDQDLETQERASLAEGDPGQCGRRTPVAGGRRRCIPRRGPVSGRRDRPGRRSACIGTVAQVGNGPIVLRRCSRAGSRSRGTFGRHDHRAVHVPCLTIGRSGESSEASLVTGPLRRTRPGTRPKSLRRRAGAVPEGDPARCAFGAQRPACGPRWASAGRRATAGDGHTHELWPAPLAGQQAMRADAAVPPARVLGRQPPVRWPLPVRSSLAFGDRPSRGAGHGLPPGPPGSPRAASEEAGWTAIRVSGTTAAAVARTISSRRMIPDGPDRESGPSAAAWRPDGRSPATVRPDVAGVDDEVGDVEVVEEPRRDEVELDRVDRRRGRRPVRSSTVPRRARARPAPPGPLDRAPGPAPARS